MLNKRSLSIAKYNLKRVIPKKIWTKSARLYETKQALEFTERVIKSKDSLFEESILVIRRRPPGGGLFSNVNHVLQGLEKARSEGLIPVVDMENYWTSYCQKQKFNGTSNSWEYFFNPVSSVKLKDVELYQTVTLSRGDRMNSDSILSDKGLKFVLNKNSINYLHQLYIEYIQLNNDCSSLLQKVKEYINWEPITVGVSYRGTDYVSLQPNGHARQPSLQEFLKAVEDKLACSRKYRLLISTEDISVRKALLSLYGDCSYKNFRSHEILSKMLPAREKASPQLLEALGYLIETYLLSESETIVSTIANGSAAAIILNGNRYSNPVIIDKGVY